MLCLFMFIHTSILDLGLAYSENAVILNVATAHNKYYNYFILILHGVKIRSQLTKLPQYQVHFSITTEKQENPTSGSEKTTNRSKHKATTATMRVLIEKIQTPNTALCLHLVAKKKRHCPSFYFERRRKRLPG